MVHAEEYKKKALDRKLRFQNQKKKNNIFKARRANNTKKRFYPYPQQQQQKPAENGPATLRKRGFFKILPADDLAKVPKCDHGPCLLFEKKDEGKPDEVYFACAVYRNKAELCDFRKNFDKETREFIEDEAEAGNSAENEEDVKKKKKKKTIFGYNQIPKSLASFSPQDTVLYCEHCINVFANKHACVCAEIDRQKLSYPTQILPPLDEQNGESQFFFSQESLDVIVSTIENSGVDGVLCLGAPRIFETVRAKNPTKNVFMLDYDKRFAKFYPSKQFAQYSMLVDHFYDKNSEEKIMEFFEKSTKVILVVDPPFGVFMEPLLKSIDKMKDRFEKTGKVRSNFYSMIILPIFIRKYVLHDDFWMSDYRVTYSNHKLYSYPEKTIVRIFTNLPKPSMNLKFLAPDYKYCTPCQKWVTKSNEHCEKCENCTNIETGKFRHCDQCSKCVKPTYIHCHNCSKCHLYKRCEF
ncbi:unnamed protein product [Caenorhabditis angaria]|uniref:CTCHY-type domain-containing protein n=1 Tax=Caenorhabditis angaria TaxID=860376 RepID=A0A9P1IGC7_9PELO|nr:unnamed protein product [Caenorhabditis angaria]